jgi:hypothetical protein
MVDSTINILDPNSSGAGGALLLHTDSSINGIGVLLPQQVPPASVGNYALNLMNSIAATPAELDLVGVLTGGTSGLGDYERIDKTGSKPMFDAVLTSNFTVDTVHAGHSAGTLTVTPAAAAVSPYSFITGTTPPPTMLSGSLYQANANQAFAIETDSQANVLGRLLLQNLP